MADRHRIVRVALIFSTVLIGVLTLYVGSFALIRWLKPDALLNAQQLPVTPYVTLYHPLRWLTAARPAFLPWWRDTATVSGTIVGTAYSHGLTLHIDGADHTFANVGPFPSGLAEHDPITIHLHGELCFSFDVPGDRFPIDAMVMLIDRIDRIDR